MTTCPFCDSPKNSQLAGGWLRCGECGLGYRAQRFAPENLAESDEDRKAVWLDSLTSINTDGLASIERILGRKGKLLDIGCGHGYFMKMAIEHGWECEGIEISAPAIRQARDVFKLKVYDKPLEMLNLPSDSYDAVTLWRVLDLLPEPRQELERIVRILKPGGLLWLRVNNFSFHYPAFRIGQTALCKKLNVQPGVIHRFGVNARSLRAVLKKTGYENVHVFNSPLTAGDPYNTGGKMGKFFVVTVKAALWGFWQAVSLLSGKRLLWSASLLAWAQKPKGKQ